MLLDRFKEQFHHGFQGKITKPSQYHAAATFLREEIRLLVAELCPEGVRIDQLSHDLDQTVDALNTYECSNPNRTFNADSIPGSSPDLQELEELRYMHRVLNKQVTLLDDQFRIPGNANYEEAQESLLLWQQKQAELQSQLAALQILADKALSADSVSAHTPLQKFQKLYTRLQELYREIVSDYDLLSRVLTRHRNFILKDSPPQRQFRILNEQVAPLLQDKQINADWYDLVQSWYKANNLANNTIKTASQQSPIYHGLLNKAKYYIKEYAPKQPENITGTDNSTISPTQIQSEINQDQLLLDQLTLRIETVRENTKKRAQNELEQVRSLWSQLEKLSRQYTGRKAASAYEEPFGELQAIHRNPYCQRTLLHWPVPAPYESAMDFGQFIYLTNQAFINIQLQFMRDFWENYSGHALTHAQCVAVLTDADYLQIVGEQGYGKSLTLAAKASYLQTYLDIRSDQILLLTGKHAFTKPAIELVRIEEPEASLRITSLFQEQNFIRTHLDPSVDSGLLLQCLELFLMTCDPADSMHYMEKHRLEELSSAQLTHAQVQEQQLFRAFKQLTLNYLNYMQDQHLTDAYTVLRKATELLNTGKAVCPYRYLLVDDFEQLSPYEFHMLQAMLQSNSLAKLTCTGSKWQIPSQEKFINKSFPLLPRDHFLVREILREAQYLSDDFLEEKSYLVLPKTRGEVVLLSPLTSD